MNDFRSRVLSGQEPGANLLKAKSRRKAAELPPPEGEESLDGLVIPREEVRAANHRFVDRHRLAVEAPVAARHKRRKHQVSIVNLSGGGAMIEAEFKPKLWDRVDLDLAGKDPSGRIETAVRWIKGKRIGLEFAHETRIDADDDTQAALLRAVLEQSFSEVILQAAAEPATQLEEPAAEPSRRSELRHPLIWTGEVHFNHDSHSIRLRNISARGALIESARSFPVGAEVFLDLGEAGMHFAHVSWAQGDQFGVAFTRKFDLSKLAAVKPQLAPDQWAKPAYLRDESRESSPWASQWGRLSLKELHKTLGR
jgi:hypothetical protein